MSAAAKVLVVDDEPYIRLLLRMTLRRANYDVIEASSARHALELLADLKPDVVLLDLGLPDRDGLDLVSLIKQQSDATLLVVSARDATDQKVEALDLGADDYITKPFDTFELLARVRTGLRHRLNTEGALAIIHVRDLTIDLVSHKVSKACVEIKLTPKERLLLVELAKGRGRVITHDQLLTRIWPSDSDKHVEYLRALIRNSRQKIEDELAKPSFIITEPGIGYRLNVE